MRLEIAAVVAGVAIAAAGGTIAGVALSETPASAVPAHHAVHRTACVTFDVSGRPAGPGMPFDEPLTFCGTGLPAGMWLCPSKTPALGPGTRLQCSREP